MAYCTIDDVRAKNPKRIYDATSKPTSTQVEQFITDISNEIDSTLSGREITVPVTTPDFFVNHLKQVNANGAAALAEMAMFPEAMGTPGGSPHGTNLYKIYKDQLRQLESGALPETVPGSGGRGPFSFGSEHPDDIGKAKFKKDKEF